MKKHSLITIIISTISIILLLSLSYVFNSDATPSFLGTWGFESIVEMYETGSIEYHVGDEYPVGESTVTLTEDMAKVVFKRNGKCDVNLNSFRDLVGEYKYSYTYNDKTISIISNGQKIVSFVFNNNKLFSSNFQLTIKHKDGTSPDPILPDSEIFNEGASEPDSNQIIDLTSYYKENELSPQFSGDLSSAISRTNDEKVFGLWTWLEVMDISYSAPDADIERINSVKTSKQHIGPYIRLLVKKQQPGKTEQSISSLNKPMNISFELPEEYWGDSDRKFTILYSHSGIGKVIKNPVFDRTTGRISFNATEFSTYCVAYEDPKDDPDDPSNPGHNGGASNNDSTKIQANSSNTGDNTYIMIVSLFVLSIFSLIYIYKGKNNY